MTNLPDMPPWPARRIAAVAALFLAGAWSLAAGALVPLSEPLALRLIDTGAEMMILAVMCYVGGASVERIGGWLGLLRQRDRGG